MNKPWENDTCENIYSYMSIYPVAVAAALWCGIPHNLVDQYLKEAATPQPSSSILRFHASNQNVASFTAQSYLERYQ